MSPTPAIAIYLVIDPVPRKLLETGKGDITLFALDEKPIITEENIVAYLDVTSSNYPIHMIRLRPEAVVRLPHCPPVTGTPFIVTVNGTRIYMGVFLQKLSSYSFGVPTILVDGNRSSSDCLFDWYWIDKNYPHRLTNEPDPRSDSRWIQTLQQLSLIHSMESEEWRKPLSDLDRIADGTSGVMVRMGEGFSLEKLRMGGEGFFPSIRGVATAMDDAQKRNLAEAELDEDYSCRLALAPGIYRIWVAIDWRNRGGPPYFSPAVVEVKPGIWSEVELTGRDR